MGDSKALLLNARKAIDASDYELAFKIASGVASNEPNNIMAKVFVGVAGSNLGKFEPAFDALRAAALIEPSNFTVLQGIVALHEKVMNSPNANSLSFLSTDEAVKLLADAYTKVLAQPFKGEKGKHFDRARRFLQFAMGMQRQVLTVACAKEIERIILEVNRETAPTEFYALAEFLIGTCLWQLNAQKCSAERDEFTRLIAHSFAILHFEPRVSRREFFAKDGSRLRELTSVEHEDVCFSRLYFAAEFQHQRLPALLTYCDSFVESFKQQRTCAISTFNGNQEEQLKKQEIKAEEMHLLTEADAPLFRNARFATFILKLHLEALLYSAFANDQCNWRPDKAVADKVQEQLDIVRTIRDGIPATVFDFHRNCFVDCPQHQASAASNLSIRVADLQYKLFGGEAKPLCEMLNEVWNAFAISEKPNLLLDSECYLLDCLVLAFAAYYVCNFERANFCVDHIRKKLAQRTAASQRTVACGELEELTRCVNLLDSWLQLCPFINLPNTLKQSDLLSYFGAAQENFAQASLLSTDKASLVLQHALVVTDALVSGHQFDLALRAVETFKQHAEKCVNNAASLFSKELFDLLVAFVNYTRHCADCAMDTFICEPPPLTLADLHEVVPYYYHCIYLRGRMLYAFCNANSRDASSNFKLLLDPIRAAAFLLMRASELNPFYAPTLIWLARADQLEALAYQRITESDNLTSTAEIRRAKRNAASRYIEAFKLLDRCSGFVSSVHRPAFVRDLLELLDAISATTEEVIVVRSLLSKSEEYLQATGLDRKSLLVCLTSRLTSASHTQNGFPTKQLVTDLPQALKELTLHIQLALRTKSTDYELWQLLGLVYEAQNNLATAQKAFARAVQLQPNATISLFKLGTLQSTACAYSEACATFCTLLRSLDSQPSLLQSLAFQGLARAHFEVVRGLPIDDDCGRIGHLWLSLCFALRTIAPNMNHFVSLWTHIGSAAFELFRLLHLRSEFGHTLLFPHFSRAIDDDRTDYHSESLEPLHAATIGNDLLNCVSQSGMSAFSDRKTVDLLLGDSDSLWCKVNRDNLVALLRLSEIAFVRALRCSRGLLPEVWHDLSLVLLFGASESRFAENCAKRAVALADQLTTVRLAGKIQFPLHAGACWMQLGHALCSRESNLDLRKVYCLTKALEKEPQFKLAGCALSSYFATHGAKDQAQTVSDQVPLVGDASSYSAWFIRSLNIMDSGSAHSTLKTFFYAFASVYSPFADLKRGRAVVDRRNLLPFQLVDASRPALFAYALHFHRALQAGLLIDNADGHYVLLTNAFSTYLRMHDEDAFAYILYGLLCSFQGLLRIASRSFEKAEKVLGTCLEKLGLATDDKKSETETAINTLLRYASLCKLQLCTMNFESSFDCDQRGTKSLCAALADQAQSLLSSCKDDYNVLKVVEHLIVLVSGLSSSENCDKTKFAAAFKAAQEWCSSRSTAEHQPFLQLQLSYAEALFSMRCSELPKAKIALLKCLQSPLINDPGALALTTESFTLRCQILISLSDLLRQGDANCDDEERAQLVDATLSEIDAALSMATQWRLRHPKATRSSLALRDDVAEYFELLHHKRLELLTLSGALNAPEAEQREHLMNGLLLTLSLLKHTVHSSPDSYTVWSLIRHVHCQIADIEPMGHQYSWLRLAHLASTNTLLNFDATVRLPVCDGHNNFVLRTLSSIWWRYYQLQVDHIQVLDRIVRYFTAASVSEDDDVAESRKYWKTTLRRHFSIFLHYYPNAITSSQGFFAEILKTLKA